LMVYSDLKTRLNAPFLLEYPTELPGLSETW
jgi:hypothetical protein